VGVAPNRLLAKLASRAAKPDGVCAADSVAAVQALLRGADVERLPGVCVGGGADACVCVSVCVVWAGVRGGECVFVRVVC
jgi:FAD/FMN-containing dehydrogenase